MELEACPTSDQIAAIASQAAFGERLITNVHRGIIAEVIVAQALGSSWTWCSADYAAWDFENTDGERLEVKQSASRQTWHGPTDAPSIISFDIRPRKGRYDGLTWIAEKRRWADIYVFAHHHVVDDQADQRDPSQWDFYVVRESNLPSAQRISLSKVRSLARLSSFATLAQNVVATAQD